MAKQSKNWAQELEERNKQKLREQSAARRAQKNNPQKEQEIPRIYSREITESLKERPLNTMVQKPLPIDEDRLQFLKEMMPKTVVQKFPQAKEKASPNMQITKQRSYFSKPRLWAASDMLETRINQAAGKLKQQVPQYGQVTGNLQTSQEKLKQAFAAWQKNPTAENRAAYEQAKTQNGRASLEYKKMVQEYKPLIEEYAQSNRNYARYAVQQAELEREWKSSIRSDEEQIQKDLTAVNKEIDLLERQKTATEGDLQQVKIYGAAVGIGEGFQQKLDEIEAKLEGLYEQRRLLKEERKYSKGQGYSALTEEEDFEALSKVDTNNSDPAYQYINDINGAREKDWGAYDDSLFLTSPEQYARLTREESRPYDFLHTEEKALFNYLWETKGKKEAMEYLDFLMNDLNYRQGREIARAYERDKLGLGQVADAAALGVQDWAWDIVQNFKKEDIPLSPQRYAFEIGREGASPLEKFVLDSAHTVGNMAPSIFLSLATSNVSGAMGASVSAAQKAGQIVGNLSMGLSAAGSAYGQALRDGYERGQARVYSALVGGSEALLQSALGGISRLGGISGKLSARIGSINNAFLRVATQTGVSMLGEGAEEALQEILAPIFAVIALDEEYTPAELEDVAYSFLLGSTMGLFFEAPDTAISGALTQAEGRRIKKIGPELMQQLIDWGMEKPEGSSGRQVAEELQARQKKGKEISPYSLGELFQETVLKNQAETAAKSSQNPEQPQQIRKNPMTSPLGQHGRKAFQQALSQGEDSRAAEWDFQTFYWAGQRGIPFEQARKLSVQGLSEARQMQAYWAGENDLSQGGENAILEARGGMLNAERTESGSQPIPHAGGVAAYPGMGDNSEGTSSSLAGASELSGRAQAAGVLENSSGRPGLGAREWGNRTGSQRVDVRNSGISRLSAEQQAAPGEVSSSGNDFAGDFGRQGHRQDRGTPQDAGREGYDLRAVYGDGGSQGGNAESILRPLRQALPLRGRGEGRIAQNMEGQAEPWEVSSNGNDLAGDFGRQGHRQDRGNPQDVGREGYDSGRIYGERGSNGSSGESGLRPLRETLPLRGRGEGRIGQNTEGQAEPTLSADELGALLQYKSSGSYMLNEKLYSGTALTQEDIKQMMMLDSALAKLPPYQGITYRSITFDLQGRKAYEDFLAMHLVDKEIVYSAYTSTSKTIDGYGISGELLIHFELEGYTGRDISEIGGYEEEQEILYPRWSCFLVKDISLASDGKPLIKMQEVPENAQGTGYFDSGERSTAMRELQKQNTSGSNMQGLSPGDSQGNIQGVARPQDALPGGRGDTLRPEGSGQSGSSTLRGVAQGAILSQNSTAGQGPAISSAQKRVAARPGRVINNEWRRKTKARTVRTVEALAKYLAVEVEFVAPGSIRTKTGQRADGEYDESSGRIRIDSRASNPILEVVKHEITHRLKSLAPEEFKAYCEFVLSAILDGDYVVEASQKLMDILDVYQQTGDFATDAALEEFMSDFSVNLLMSETLIRKLCRENMSLGQKILEWIKDLLAGVLWAKDAIRPEFREDYGLTESQLKKAEQLYIEGLRAANRQAQRLLTENQGQEKIAPEKQGDGNIKYSAQRAKPVDFPISRWKDEQVPFIPVPENPKYEDGRSVFTSSNIGRMEEEADRFIKNTGMRNKVVRVTDGLFEMDVRMDYNDGLRKVIQAKLSNLGEKALLLRLLPVYEEILRSSKYFGSSDPGKGNTKVEKFNYLVNAVKVGKDYYAVKTTLTITPTGTIDKMHGYVLDSIDIAKINIPTSLAAQNMQPSQSAETLRGASGDIDSISIFDLFNSVNVPSYYQNFIRVALTDKKGMEFSRKAADSVFAETMQKARDRRILDDISNIRQIDKADKKIAPEQQGDGKKYKIAYDVNNTPFVIVEEDILMGLPREQWVNCVKDRLRQKFPDGITVGRNVVLINQQSRRETTFSKYMQSLLRKAPDLYADKLRALNNADEIIKASNNYVNEALSHLRKDAILDFARGEVLLRIGTKDYRAEVIVGNRGNGNLILYDIVNLSKTKIQEKTKKEGAGYTTKPQKETGGRQSAPFYAPTLSQNEAGVNKQSTQNKGKYTGERERDSQIDKVDKKRAPGGAVSSTIAGRDSLTSRGSVEPVTRNRDGSSYGTNGRPSSLDSGADSGSSGRNHRGSNGSGAGDGIGDSPLSIESYTEESYDRYGWAAVNGLLNEKELASFLKKIGQIAGGEKGIRTRRGQYIIPVGENFGLNNKLIFSNGNYQNPSIEKVVVINLEYETLLEEIRGDIYDIETGRSTLSLQAYQEIAGEEVLRVYEREDLGDYRQIQKQKGAGLQGNAGAFGELPDGRRSAGEAQEAGELAPRYSLPSRNPLSIESYTEESYARYGWAVVNGLLNESELANFLKKIGQLAGGEKGIRTRRGQSIIPVGERFGVNNKLIFSNGDYQKPSIERVIVIDLYTETEIDRIRRLIYDRESKPGSLPHQSLGEIVGEWLYEELDRNDFPDYSEMWAAGAPAGTKMQADPGLDGELPDGGRSAGEDQEDGESGLRLRYSLPSRNPLSIESYTEESYARYGWAVVNGLLNESELANFLKKIGQLAGGEKGIRTRRGQSIIPVGERFGVNNKLIFSNGDYQNPSIERVIVINLYTETEIDDVRRIIYESETKPGAPSSKVVEDYLEQWLLERHDREDWPDYWQAGRAQGAGLQRDAGAFGELPDGGRSAGEDQEAGELEPRYSLPSIRQQAESLGQEKSAPEQQGDGKKYKISPRRGFVEDKYYAKNIQDWEKLNSSGSTRVGLLREDSPLAIVGLRSASIYIDNSKLQTELKSHGDHLTASIVQKIPQLLSDPILINDPSIKTPRLAGAIDVYGDVEEFLLAETPILVGVTIAKDRSGAYTINKINTIHARKNWADSVSDESVLYLNPDKKRTKAWFQARGTDMPLGGTKFGPIRRIAYDYPNSKVEHLRDSARLVAESQNSIDEKKAAHSLPSRNPLSIESYTEESYARYGWAVVNGLLNESELANFLQKIGQLASGEKGIRTRRGQTIIPVGERFGVNNKLIFSNGDYQNPSIEKVIEIDLYTETQIDDIRRFIYDRESNAGTLSYEALEFAFPETVFGIYEPGYLPAYEELIGKGQRGLRQTDSGASGALRDGRRSAGEDQEAGELAPRYSLPSIRQQAESLGQEKSARENQGGKKYKIADSFATEMEDWVKNTSPGDRISSRGYFTVGTVSTPLKSIGVRNGKIYWRKSKIAQIMEDHPEIDENTIKRIPELLENPVIVMKSQTRDDSITLFGELTAANGNPVMAALDLTPKPGGSMEAEFTLLSSVYSRTKQNIRNLVLHSKILYLDPQKNRTDTWLMQIRVQFPSRQPAYGSIGTISYANGKVNIQGPVFSEYFGLGNESPAKAALRPQGREAAEKDPLSIESYTEESYDRYGWAAVNGLLNESELANFLQKIGQIAGGEKGIRIRRGQYIIPVGENFGVNNKLIFSNGNYQNPSIEKVIEIDLYTETEIDEIRRVIYDRESKSGLLPDRAIENAFREELFCIHLREYYPTYAELIGESQRGLRQVGTGASGALRDGRRSAGEDSGDGELDPRYSLPEIRRRERERMRLRQEVDYLKGELKQNRAKDADPKQMKALAGQLLLEYGSTYARAELSQALLELYRLVRQGQDPQTRAEEIAGKILENTESWQEEGWQAWQELQAFLAEQGDKPAWESRAALAEFWPEWFLEDADSQQIEATLEQLESIYASSAAMQLQKGWVAADICQRAFAIPPRETFADKEARKLAEARLAERMHEGRAAAEAKRLLALEREKRKSQVAALQEEQRSGKKAQSRKQKEKELRAKIQRAARRLSPKLLRPNNEKHIPEELRQIVAQLLAAINLESSYSISPLTGRKLPYDGGTPTKKTASFRALRQAYLKIIREEGDLPLCLDPLLLENLAELGAMEEKPLSQLGLEELEKMWQCVKAVEASIETANKALGAARFASIQQAAEGLLAENQQKEQKKEYAKGRARVDRLLHMDMLTPEAFFHRLGQAGDDLFHMLSMGQDQQIRILQQAAQDSQRILEAVDVRQLEEEAHSFVLESGKSLRMSTAQIMSLAMLLERPQARQHILEGGIRPKSFRGRNGALTQPTNALRLSEADCTAILSVLNKEQLDLAKRLQSYLCRELAEVGNRASMEVYGYEKFTDPDYFPIEVDKNQLGRDTAPQGQGQSIAGWSSAQQTVEGAKNPLMLDSIFAVYAQHISGMASYGAWLAPLENLRRIRDYRFRDEKGQISGSVKGLIQFTLGKDGLAYLDQLMEDLNRATQLRNSGFTDQLISNVKAAAVAANVRVVIQQPTAVLRALTEIDGKYLRAGMLRKGDWERVMQYAPIARWKDWGHFDINTGRQLRDVLLGTDSGLEKAKQTGMWLAGKADSLSWTAIWNAVELETRAERQDLPPGTEEFYQAVGDRFTQIINKTQVVDGLLQRSQIMRSQDALTRLSTSFMGEPTKSYNMFLNAVYDWRKAQGPESRKAAGKKLARTLLALNLALISNAIAQSLVDALRDDEKEKKYWEKCWEAFIGKSFWSGNLQAAWNPLNYLPYARDVFSIAQGYEASRIDLDSIEKVLRAAVNFYKALRGEGKQALGNAALSLLVESARLLGLPLANLRRDIQAVLITWGIETENYLYQYRLDRFLYNPQENKARFLDILYAAYEKDPEAYALIRDALLQEGFSEDELKKAIVQRQKEEEDYLEKLESLESGMLESLEGKSAWRALSAERKEAAEKAVQEYAKALAYWQTYKKEPLEGWKAKAHSARRDLGLSPEQYILLRQRYGRVDKKGSWIATVDAAGRYEKMCIAKELIGISPGTYLEFCAGLSGYDADENGSYSHAELEEAVKDVPGLSKAQRAKLWQLQSGSESTKNNPFSRTAARDFLKKIEKE